MRIKPVKVLTPAEILRKTARHIRRYPDLWEFIAGRVPERGERSKCRACALARAATFMHGIDADAGNLTPVAIALGFRATDSDTAEGVFYSRVDSALRTRHPDHRKADITTAPPGWIAKALEDVAASL